MIKCKVSGKSFEVSEFERGLRKKLGAPMPDQLPKYTFRQLAAFWPQFSIYKRKCDGTGKQVISVYDEWCPYPIWERDYWVENAEPPFAEFNFGRPFFEQLFELFQKSPIPNNIGIQNQNCEYMDDVWFSKNCYLCHNGAYCEDCHYCHRVVNLKDCYFCAYSFDSELCIDLINSKLCYGINYAIDCQKCRDGAFLFDCRDCENCMFCWNLRAKKFCILNKQYSEEEYLEELKKFDLRSRSGYEKLKYEFLEAIKKEAFWKADDIEKCQNVTGDKLENCKNCENCFLTADDEDCVNCARGFQVRDCLDSVSPCFHTEKVYYSLLAQERCYEVYFSFNLTNCRYMRYCSNCLNCEHCFGCQGLVGRKYCILNKEYEPAEYEKLLGEILARGGADGFFPWHFAPIVYDDSLAGFCAPLTVEEQEGLGVRRKHEAELKRPEYLYQQRELDFFKARGVALPEGFYVKRIKENTSWAFFKWELRETVCAKTGKKVTTCLPEFLNGRIVSKEAHLKLLY